MCCRCAHLDSISRLVSISSPDTNFFTRALWPCQKIGSTFTCAQKIWSGDERRSRPAASYQCSPIAMASKVVKEASCYEWSSYIRRYHDYQAVWTSTIGEVLKVEPTNPHDDFTVSIVKGGAVVGHVVKYVSSYLLLSQEGWECWALRSDRR